MTTGASLLASSASLMLLRGVDAATHDGIAPAAEGHHTNDEMKRCIQLCQDCHALCIQVIGHCINLGGRHATPEHIRLLLDCAQICTTTADYMARESVLHQRVCSLCSEICMRCAESCEQVAGDDQLVKQCAEMCRRCAESCKKMASKEA
ncbi:MAG: four-helix bundle copper-binding protein [Candidatus Binatia bacterium]